MSDDTPAITKEERAKLSKWARVTKCDFIEVKPSTISAYEATLTKAEARVKELEEAQTIDREMIAEANNSLFGSQGYFLSINGGLPEKYHLADEIEKLKREANKRYADVTKAEARISELEEALKPFVNLVAKNEDGELEDQLEGLPDGHAFDVSWRTDGCGDKSPWVSARHFRRARAALKGNE